MGFQELELHDIGRLVQQTPEIAQAPRPVMHGGQGDPFQFGHWMFFGQLQQPLHDPQSLRAALGKHLLGPGAGLRSEQTAPVQKIINAPFDEVAFAAVKIDLSSKTWTGVCRVLCCC